MINPLNIANAIIAIIGGVAGAMLLYWALNNIVQRLPSKWEQRVKPWVFVGPAILLIGLFLVYPAIRTIIISFANSDTTEWVGPTNYIDLLADPAFQETLINTLALDPHRPGDGGDPGVDRRRAHRPAEPAPWRSSPSRSSSCRWRSRW